MNARLRAVARVVPVLWGLALVACAREQPKPAPPRAAADAPLPEVVLAPSGAAPARVKVELARTPAEQSRGLMYRDKQLADDRGMLFLSETPRQHHFWMHNTYIPLDMIFIGADRRVVGVVENAVPLTDDDRSVEGISQFVLEVRAGFAMAHRVGPGTPVEFVGIELSRGGNVP